MRGRGWGSGPDRRERCGDPVLGTPGPVLLAFRAVLLRGAGSECPGAGPALRGGRECCEDPVLQAQWPVLHSPRPILLRGPFLECLW